MNPRVSAVQSNPDYTLTLKFTNGEMRRFDVKPYLDKGIFQELRDLQNFNKVKPFLGSVQWQGGQDFCPDTLYEDSVSTDADNLEEIMDEASEEAERNGLTSEILESILEDERHK